MNKNQKGFGVIEGLLILIIVGLIGFVGWYVYHAKNTTDATLNSAANTNITASTGAKKKAATQTDSTYAGWKTYTSSNEGLSFKYPTTWTATNDPCVNPDTQVAGECYQFSTPQVASSPYVFNIVFYWNQQAASAINQGETMKVIKPLDVPNSKTPLSLVGYSLNQENKSNVFGLTLTDQKYSADQTVSYIPNVASQKQSGMTYTLTAVMKTPSQQDISNYTLAQYQAQPDYGNVINMFKSLSY